MFKTALNIGISVIEIYLPCEILALWNPTKVGAKQFHRASNFCFAKIISQGKYFGACNLLFYKKYLC